MPDVVRWNLRVHPGRTHGAVPLSRSVPQENSRRAVAGGMLAPPPNPPRVQCAGVVKPCWVRHSALYVL
jgi:hypothetical protein